MFSKQDFYKICAGLTFLICTGSFVFAQKIDSPYSRQQSREIKALSPQDVDSYLAGHGMGFAKSAELNHYPGPKHVLELAEHLKLSETQRDQTNKIFAKMKNEAVRLGKEYVERERQLDNAFNRKTIDQQKLQTLTSEIGQLRSQLRFVHLSAHLKMKQLLSPEQIAHYDKLRGYTGGHQKHNHQSHRN